MDELHRNADAQVKVGAAQRRYLGIGTGKQREVFHVVLARLPVDVPGDEGAAFQVADTAGCCKAAQSQIGFIPAPILQAQCLLPALLPGFHPRPQLCSLHQGCV